MFAGLNLNKIDKFYQNVKIPGTNSLEGTRVLSSSLKNLKLAKQASEKSS